VRDPQEARTWGDSGDDQAADDVYDYDVVILPARLDADLARRVAVASNRDGVSVADLLGRAAAAYDWSEQLTTAGTDPFAERVGTLDGVSAPDR
jgi:hypothetical protein